MKVSVVVTQEGTKPQEPSHASIKGMDAVMLTGKVVCTVAIDRRRRNWKVTDFPIEWPLR